MNKLVVACLVDDIWWFPFLTLDDKIDWSVRYPGDHVKVFYSRRFADMFLKDINKRITSPYALEIIEVNSI